MKSTPITSADQFADVIREAVRERGLTYRELVKGTEHNHNLIWSVVSCAYEPKISTAIDACEVMGLELVVRKKGKRNV